LLTIYQLTMFKHNIRPLAPLALAWLLSAMLGTAAAQTAKRVSSPAEPRPACVVAEFKGIGLNTHDPQERSVKAAQWLQRNGSACSLAQAITITSNRSAWLGTADTPLLIASIEGMVESRQNAAAAAQTASAAAKPLTTPGTPPTATPGAAATPTAAAPVAATTTTSGIAPAPTNRAAAAPMAVPVVVPVAVPAAQAARPPV
jgi:hypothetical protein